MKILLLLAVAAVLLSTKVFAALPPPGKCSASLIEAYTQQALDTVSGKTGPSSRQILVTTLLKIKDLCAASDDGSELAEYFPEKIHNGAEIFPGTENRIRIRDSGLAAMALTDLRNLARHYVQASKPASHCYADRFTTSGMTALYADRFHEEFIGFLQEGARVHILHPHLLRSSLSGAVIKVQVIANASNLGRDHEGKSGFISAADTNWHEDCL